MISWEDIESSFNRALSFSFTKKKLLLTFPTLLLSFTLVIFCRALSLTASPWVSMSLIFLPIFLASGLLLGLGVILARIYHREVKKISVSFKKLMVSSLDIVIAVSYLALPPLIAYLLLWMALGLFFLLKQVPGFGEFFSVILSFAPFLLILGSLILCMLNLALLFFVAPLATLKSMRKGTLMKTILKLLKFRFFSAFTLFFIGILPLLLVSFLLCIAALMTNDNFFLRDSTAAFLQWFFMMIPIALILTPPTIFFFHFSSESHALLLRREA